MSQGNNPAPKEKGAELPKTGDALSETENIGKIRDILFGSQAKQIEKKLMAMEGRIEKGFASMRSETKSTLETLEQFTRKELRAIADQLNQEKTERMESADTLSERIGDAKKGLENKLRVLSDKVVENQREAQDQILQQAKTVMTELREKNDALQKHVDRSIGTLSQEKTDRLALADLLMEAAMQLKNEFQSPEPE